jgi:hypothetical protein
MIFKKLFLFLTVLSIINTHRAQNIGIGADAVYNFQTTGFGNGIRASIFPNKRLSFIPQVTYFYSFNKVHEYYAGLGISYTVLKIKKFNFYTIAHGAYNDWINYKKTPDNSYQRSNWNLEAGGGITMQTCLRPYIESRYNIKFQEAHVRIGLLYVFGCKNKKDKYADCPEIK